MSVIPAQRTMNWRDAQIALMGKEAFNRLEAQKRKERRQRAKQRPPPIPSSSPPNEASSRRPPPLPTNSPPNEEEEKPPPLPSKPPPNDAEGKAENCEELLEQVFLTKSKYLASLRPPRTIKKQSVKQQLTKVINLYRKMTGQSTDCRSFDFLRPTAEVINFINTHWKTPNSRNSQVQAIASILQSLGGYEDEYEFYSGYSTDERRRINETVNENKTTDREAVNLIPWKDVKNLYKSNIDKPDKALIGIYTLLPPRRVEDVSLLTLTDKDEDLSTDLNYIIVNKNKKPLKIVYLRYKTDKTYGRQDIKIPTKLATIIQDFIKTYNLQLGTPLFPTANDGYYKNFGEIVANTFKKHIGKSMSANLRHSFISDFLSRKRTIAKKTEIARLMGHNIGTQGQYDRIDL